jgi:Tol biopolymer transport system component
MHLDVPVDLTLTTDVNGFPTWHGGRIYSSYDWSPDGSEIVIQRRLAYEGLWYGTAPDWELTPIHAGYNPRWSPDGGQILFCSAGVWRMDPDPLTNEDLTATQLVVKPTSTKRTVYVLDDACWSPNGTHIVYELSSQTLTPYMNKADIYRICADGTGTVNLTGDIDTLPVPIAWR